MPQEVPAISVVVPAFNAGRWIAETLESILAQSRPAHEVIVVDDGSTDDTAEIASGFDERVRVLRQENGGPSAAYNRGFREAEGEFVAMCSADDLWEPRKLEWQAESVAADPRIDVAFGRAREFGDVEADYPAPARTGAFTGDEMLRTLYAVNLIPAPSALVRRALQQEAGGFREDLACEDYEFWLRAASRGARFFFDDRLLVKLRIHGGNLSSQTLTMWNMNYELHREYASDLEDRALVRHSLARDLHAIGRASLGLGDLDRARAAFRGSLRHKRTPAALAWAVVTTAPGARPALRWALRRRARTGEVAA